VKSDSNNQSFKARVAGVILTMSS